MAPSLNYPKLHNAMWPGLVGKGSPGAEPAIDLETMLDLTANASVDGVAFDGVDLFLFDPHVSIDSTRDEVRHLADRIAAKGFVVGSLVAPVWPPTGGGSAMGSDDDRHNFLTQVRKACAIGQMLRDTGIRSYGVVRIDSAAGAGDWAKDPDGNTRRIAATFSEACDIAEGYGERLAAEGEICWGGMHSWKRMVQLLELVGRPKTLGFQADMAHTLLYTMGYNAPEDRILPEPFDWNAKKILLSELSGLRGSTWFSTTRSARLPMHCGRGRSIFTSRRMTGPCSAQARTTRPAAIACRPIPTASSISSATRASGCATRRAVRRARSSTSAGMAACFRTRR
jgi:sugar phosphate isomerase/epimerase